MTLIIIRGDVGSGKTLLATGFAMEDPRSIRANYHINKPGFTLLEPEDLNHLTEATLAIIDEAWAWLESRLSGKPINIFLSRILFLSRKKRLDMILTTQLDGVIDKRFRLMANFVIDCQRIPEGFLYQVTPRGHKPYTLFLSNEDAELLYPYYDTWEEVTATDDAELSYRIVNKQNLLPRQDKIIDEMLEISPVKNWSLKAVEAYFLEKHYAHAEAKDVYGRIKLRGMREKAQEGA